MFSVAKDSLTKSFNKPIPWLALVVIPLIVALFGTLYVVTYNDPFGRMESMPVALINLDEGVEAENGETTNYGDDIIDSLLEENSVLWTEESAALLDAGLETTDYYLAVVIPEDFSELVSAGETSNPEVANITFYKNQRKNYLLATLSSSLENSLRTAVNEQISEQYATALAEGLISAEEGFSQAAEGSDTLAVGLQSAIEGSEALESGTVELAEGAETLSSGIGELTVGASEFSDGLATLTQGSTSLVEGLETLSSGTEELSSGVSTLTEGSSSLEEGASELSAGLSALSEQNETLTSGSAAVESGLDSLVAGSNTFESALASNVTAIEASSEGNPSAAVSEATSAYEQALTNYATAVATAATDGSSPAAVSTDELTAAVTALAQASAAQASYETLITIQDNYASLASGITALDSQYTTLDSGIVTYTEVVSELAVGAAQLESGASSINAGLISVQNGTNSLENGVTSAATGAEALDTGLASAQGGASALTSGTDSAYAGANQIGEGANALTSGTSELIDGLADATEGTNELTQALTEGADSIAESLATDAETMGEYISQPVDLTDDIYGEVDNFGTGMAPLFLSLCMWLGSLLIFFVFEAFPSHKYLGVNRLRAIVGRWPLYLLFVVAEIVAVTAACVGFDLQMTSLPLLVLTLTCMGFTFMCIMQCLNLFDVIGKAIAVILIICQLVFCYSTFPAFLGSDIAVAVAPFLPFYYSIDALREVISGGVASAVYADLGMLLLFAVGAIVASLVLYPLALRLKRYRDAQQVQDITGKSLEAIQAGA